MTASLAPSTLTRNGTRIIEADSEFLFEPGNNCWRRSFATHATPLVDCENYFKALHQSISKARHSIFIVGWDIDSRIRLLRGQDAEDATIPVVISDLIQWKAEQEPAIKIYLLRWDSSVAFLKTREIWPREIWDYKTPSNVYTMMDDSMPMGGSQHQKIIIVDDEIAFTGGMDIAAKRWDTREHRFSEPEREDEGEKYDPFHDVQVVTAGPVVKEFAELARWRWNRVSDIKAIHIRETSMAETDELPPAWPKLFPPLLHNIHCAIARTLPPMENVEPVQEVNRMLIDLVRQAKHFIYIENQYATRIEIAEALNQQLRSCKTLKVLIVSSCCPNNAFESEAYWASRIDFKQVLEKGVHPSRVALTHSFAYGEKKVPCYKRIHSKLMVIDDNYLVIGSSNLNNRSMSLDTECDLVFSASTSDHRTQIESIRNDLLAEHSGSSVEKVRAAFKRRRVLGQLMKKNRRHQYAIAEVKDGSFTNRKMQSLFRFLSDPDKPLISPMRWLNGKRIVFRNPRRKPLLYGIAILVFTLFMGFYAFTNNGLPLPSSEQISTFLNTSRESAWAVPLVCLLYLFGAITFFPVMLISIAVAAVFGPLWGPVYGTLGALFSATFMFSIGRVLGKRSLRVVGGVDVEVVSNKIRHSNIMDVIAIRFMPIAPFSLVNLVAGIASVGLLAFLSGTLVGLLPSMFAKGLVGDAIMDLYLNPSLASSLYLLGGTIQWVALVIISQKFAKYYQQQKLLA